MLAGLDEGEK